MRLAQLARKLSLKQSEIVEFLAQHSIEVEDTANAKVEYSHVQLIIEKLAPHIQLAVAEDLGSSEPEKIIEEPIAVIEPVSAQEEIIEEPVVEQIQETVSEVVEETTELIRVPKIELTGLKVLGRIELPEKKKKEDIIVRAEETIVTETDKKVIPRERTVKNDRKPKPQQRTSRNPLADAREREKREEEEKRRQEIERKKEIRTQNYMKKVQVKAPMKRTKPETATTPKFQKIKKEEPKTLWGRFVKWLTT